MNDLSKTSVSWEYIDETGENQRIDNYLIKRLKGVPKSHIYRILRNGEVRVNSKRVSTAYRLQAGDRLRIPPVRTAKISSALLRRKPVPPVSFDVLYQDNSLLVINKPSGVAVHGGSGVSLGVVEMLRLQHPEGKFLELAHRIDRGTSGVLLLAKKRAALLDLHRQLREGLMEKSYLALVKGRWRNRKQNVRLPLNKYLTASGERRVNVREQGLAAHTVCTLQKAWKDYSLLEAELKTGRTHQIRVHLSHLGFPIAGDDKYGDFGLNKELKKLGLARMFLHAYKVALTHPDTGEKLELAAPLPADLERFLSVLDAQKV